MHINTPINRIATAGAVIISAMACSLFGVSCEESKTDPAEAPKAAFRQATDILMTGDYEAYSDHLDYGSDIDSSSRSVMLNVLKQHSEWQNAEKGGLDSCSIVAADMESDTVATIYYRLVFGNGTSEVSSQKMVRTDGVWKIRVRN